MRRDCFAPGATIAGTDIDPDCAEFARTPIDRLYADRVADQAVSPDQVTRATDALHACGSVPVPERGPRLPAVELQFGGRARLRVVHSPPPGG